MIRSQTEREGEICRGDFGNFEKRNSRGCGCEAETGGCGNEEERYEMREREREREGRSILTGKFFTIYISWAMKAPVIRPEMKKKEKCRKMPKSVPKEMIIK